MQKSYMKGNIMKTENLFCGKGICLGILFLITFSGTSHRLLGQTNTWDGSSSSNWNTAANWSLNLVPTSGHDVVIPDNFSVTVNTAAVCKTFTINGGGNSNTVTISTGQSLTVSGAVTINGGTGNNDNKTIAVGSSSFSCASISMADPGNDNRYCRVSATTGTINVTGNIVMSGNAARNQITFTGAGTLNLGGSIGGGDLVSATGSIVNYNGSGAQTVAVNSDYIYSNIHINNTSGAVLQASVTTSNVTANIRVISGTLSNGGFAITGNSGGVFEVANGATILLTGTSTMATGFGTITLGNTSVVNYSGANQTIAARTYGNLTLSGSGTKTAGGAVTVNGTTILNGVTFKTGSTTGYSSSLGILSIGNNSTIALGTGTHTLTLSNSTSASWTGTLSITGWVNPTVGKIQVGVNGLSSTQLGQVSFSGYSAGANISASGELVPKKNWQAQFVSMNTGSATWCAGETREITVTVKNVGTSTWTNSSPDINIGVKWNTNGTNWTDYYVRTDANNLAPGETATYTFTITASNNTGTGYTTPLASGTNNLTFDVVNEGDCWFGNNSGTCGPGNTVFTSSALTMNETPAAVNVSPTSATICNGNIQQITASGGNIIGSLGSGGGTTTGNSNTSALGPNPLQNYYGGSKQQMLVTAAELNAMGLSSGSLLSSIGINLANASTTYALQNLKVKIQHTTLTALTTAFINSGFSTVFGPSSYNPVAGLNTIQFSTGFEWNGTNNILIEITFSNNNSGATSNYNTATYNSTTPVTTSFYRADNQSASAVEAVTTASYTYNSRNNLKIGFQNITWSPVTGLFKDAAATNAYTAGTKLLVVYAKPENTTEYTASALNSSGCTQMASSQINVNQLPAISSHPSDASVYMGMPASFTVVASGTSLSYQWQVSTDGGISFSNISSAGVNPVYSDWNSATLNLSGTTYSNNNYRYRCVVSGVCSPPVTSTAAVLTVDNALTWTGAVSADWNVTGNWNHAIEPDSDVSVIIPSGPSQQPVIIQSASLPALCNNLTINPGAVLTIEAGKALTVSGSLINNAGTSGLVIKSDAVGTGSLLNGSANVNATVERYIAAADWGQWDDGWHFISSPVASQTINSVSGFVTSGPPSDDYDLYAWHEPGNVWVNFKNTTSTPTWNDVNNNSPDFLVGKGYMASYQATDTKEFKGVMNVSDVSVTGLGISNGSNQSWHLLGNPYASALAWDGLWTTSNIAGVAKIWNEAGKAYQDLTPADVVNSVIPCGNGFMVEVSSGTGSLTIPSSKRIHSGKEFQKQGELPLIVFTARNIENPSFQQSTLVFNPLATESYDLMYDGHFLPGYAPLFYSVYNGQNLSTNSLPSIESVTSIPFSFIKNEGVVFDIEARIPDNFPASVFLKDKLTGADHNFSNNPVYHFTSSENDSPERFQVHFKALGTGNDLTNNSISVFSTQQKIIVSSASALNADVRVSNLQGQVLLETAIRNQQYTELNIQGISEGIYVVTLLSKESSFSRKIVLMNH